jgi:hypothetical protein
MVRRVYTVRRVFIVRRIRSPTRFCLLHPLGFSRY